MNMVMLRRRRSMTVFIAPLLSDSHFLPSWNATPVEIVETQEAKRVFEKKCHESAFLQSRFNVCGNDFGWKTKIAKTSLQVWQPDTKKISFMTEPLEEVDYFFPNHKSFKPQRVTMMFEDSKSPALWSIPKEASCEFHTIEVDEASKHGSDISVADAEAAAESALCIYVSRKCEKIQMTSPIPTLSQKGQESFEAVINVTAEDIALMYVDEVNSHTITGRQAHVFSSVFFPLLQCYRARGPLWPEWVEPHSWWKASVRLYRDYASEWKMDPDAILIYVSGADATVEMKDIVEGIAVHRRMRISSVICATSCSILNAVD